MSDAANAAAVSTDAFSIVAAAVLPANEGPELDRDPNDSGNWTGGAIGVGRLLGSRFGISAAQYPEFDFANGTWADAFVIYRRDYWLSTSCHLLPVDLATIQFDTSVNCGQPTARLWLQTAIGVRADGKIGPVTLAALKRSDTRTVMRDLVAIRAVAEAQMPIYRHDALGMERRLAALPYQAIDALATFQRATAIAAAAPLTQS